MRKHQGWILAAALGAMLGGAGCEETDPVAPKDGQILLTANPATVVIDTDAGETSASSSIAAQLFNAQGLPLTGLPVTFSTSGGRLDSGDNSCAASRCRITGDSCSRDADCPPVAPRPIETNGNGLALDTLTLFAADPAEVTVTARSATLSQTVTVKKTLVQGGNASPTAELVLTPAGQQRKGSPVTFDGDGSSDPDGSITCYQWSISSSDSASDEVVQGQIQNRFTRRYATEQTLSVILRVSDDEDAATFCARYEGPPGDPLIAPESAFRASDSANYEIVCDLTAPVADGGPDQTVTLAGASVEVVLNGSATDPEPTSFGYRWTCGNGQAAIEEQQATCTYTSTGTFTAQLRVTNDCGLVDTDDVTVRVNAP